MSDRLFAHRTATWLVLSLCLVGLLTLGPAAGTAVAWQDEKADKSKEAEPPPADDDTTETASEPGAAPADGTGEGDAAGSDKVQSSNMLKRFAGAMGFFFGPVFLLISFLLVALIMMNVLQIRRETLLPSWFLDEFEELLETKDLKGAYELSRDSDSMVARVLTAGVGKLNRGYSEAIEGMQEVGEDENMALEHRLSYLALIGSVAPMIGLSGTVTGMIASFSESANSATSPKPADLAVGISQALWTTLVGLGIAIPAMVAYSILRNRSSRLVLEVGMVSEGLMGRFQSAGRSKPAAGGGGGAAPSPPPPTASET